MVTTYNIDVKKHSFEQFKKLTAHVKNEKRKPEEIYISLGGILPEKEKDVDKSNSQFKKKK